MPLSVKQLLELQGIKPRDEHLETLEDRWEKLLALRGNLESANVEQANISLRNIPGGDHVE